MNPHWTSFYELTILFAGIGSLIAAHSFWSLTRISREMTPKNQRTQLGEDLRWMWIGMAILLAATSILYMNRFFGGDSLHHLFPLAFRLPTIVLLNASFVLMIVKSRPVNRGMRALLVERNAQRASAQDQKQQAERLDQQETRQNEQQVILDETALVNTKRGRYLSKAGVVLDTRRMTMAHEQHDMDDHQHAMNARDVVADARDVTADERDKCADERDALADERDTP